MMLRPRLVKQKVIAGSYPTPDPDINKTEQLMKSKTTPRITVYEKMMADQVIEEGLEMQTNAYKVYNFVQRNSFEFFNML
jgi:hypothetical protein